MPWPVEFDGHEYSPIPASWLQHSQAEDRNCRTGPRLLAVAATTIGGRTLRLRYAHPIEPFVLVCQTAAEPHNGGVVPAGLVRKTGWDRSLCPGPSEPSDRRRRCEADHMKAIWGAVLKDPPWPTATTSTEVPA